MWLIHLATKQVWLWLSLWMGHWAINSNSLFKKSGLIQEQNLETYGGFAVTLLGTFFFFFGRAKAMNCVLNYCYSVITSCFWNGCIKSALRLRSCWFLLDVIKLFLLELSQSPSQFFRPKLEKTNWSTQIYLLYQLISFKYCKKEWNKSQFLWAFTLKELLY